MPAKKLNTFARMTTATVARKPAMTAKATMKPSSGNVQKLAEFDALMTRLEVGIAQENSTLDALLERLTQPSA